MGLKSEIDYKLPGWNEHLESYPSTPLRVRFLDRFVEYFPRRLLSWTAPDRLEKIVSHVLFFNKPLTATVSIEDNNSFTLGVADTGALEALFENEETFPEEVYLHRINRGDICYCLVHEGALKCYQWVNLDFCSIYCGFASEIIFHRMNKHTAYLYDFYTFEKFRGQGYGKALKSFVFSDLYRSNFRNCCNAIHYDNLVSLKIHLNNGFELEGLAYIYRLMSLTGTTWGTTGEVNAVRSWLRSFDFNA